MARGKKDLDTARAEYRDAKNRGDRQEQAGWANQIGHLLKARGEYVEALKWFQIDYDLSLKHLPQKQLMPTCQSIGEMYLRLQRFRDALAYQKKHLEFAQEADDLEEQQRASTQLCRTFFDIHDKDENNYSALRKAKKYSQLSLELACTLKENPPSSYSPSFVTELVNAYNNKGLLKIYLEDYKEAERVLMEGLRICDEEEMGDNKEVHARLHHNLARIYIEDREWAKAREHVDVDIGICQHISHPQGEALGFINLGVIHCKLQKHEDALHCFNKALAIARSLEDEDALVQHIESNIETTRESQKTLGDLVQGEQHLKNLDRNASAVRGMPAERGCYIQQFKCLKQLIDLARQIEAWTKHLEFAKRSNSVAKELGDKEKLADALLAVGESYYNLRKFDKANKWYTKSWKVCATIRNLEGQAVAKINTGNALDSAGNWSDALEAFQEGYKTAVQEKIVSLQITALQNMQYSYLLRFDNLEDARKLEHDIERLKGLASEKGKDKALEDEQCSKTANSVENFIDLSENELDMDSSPYCGSQKSAEKISLYGQFTDNISNQMRNANPIEDDLALPSYMQSCNQASQKRTAQQDSRRTSLHNSVENFIDLSENELDMDSSPYCGSQKSAEKISLYGQFTDNISNQMRNANPIEDDLAFASYMQSCNQASQKRTAQQDTRNEKKCKKTCLEKEIESQAKISCDLRMKASVTQQPLGCKRSRILLPDDEKSNNSRGVRITENTVQVNELSEVDSTDNNRQGSKKVNSKHLTSGLLDEGLMLFSER